MDFSKPVAINLKKLMKMVNPFDSSVWVNMKAPIKKSEVSDCIKS